MKGKGRRTISSTNSCAATTTRTVKVIRILKILLGKAKKEKRVSD
jgi:hypothetical protein